MFFNVSSSTQNNRYFEANLPSHDDLDPVFNTFQNKNIIQNIFENNCSLKDFSSATKNKFLDF